ncbi:MAG: hypothetical protein D3916_09095 [Candidatus Electrothrix sp. MAN1_4]|nr:hypothetical protein [Candidatus Electrothrix sp. MAN1_4]
MLDETIFKNAYDNVTTLHPLALSLTIGCGLALLAVNRKYATIPMLLLICFTAPAQRIVIFSLDFNLARVMVVVGLLRIFIKHEADDFVWKPIDKIMIAWTVSSTAAYILLRGTTDALIYKLGTGVDALGMYFMFRCLVKDMEDVRQVAVGLACLSIPVAFFLYYEKQTGRNLFSVFGGVPEFTAIRQGKLRAQGAFAHPIIAGCFWVTQLPLFLALWWQDTKKWLIAASVSSVFFIVYACASSSPAAGIGAVAIGIAFYGLRHSMDNVRKAILALLVSLHLVMKAPVWHLIGRIDLVGGSTGFHRYMLIDNTIRRFSEWWLFGILSTAHWGWHMFDTANMYVSQAVRGGFLTLIFFVILIGVAFKGVGDLLDSLEDGSPDYIFAWLLGVALFTHCMVFIAVSYFGQATVVWYLLLAIIGSLTPVAHIAEESDEHAEVVASLIHNRTNAV